MTDLAATSLRLADLGVDRATLLVDPARARANIARFVARARTASVVLRPHFKTHQSSAVGEWFAAAGVDRATVSSVGQAAYFADHGWRDLTLAIGLNPRELPAVRELAGRCDLGVTVDHPAQVAALAQAGLDVGAWVEIDTDDGRAGVHWSDTAAVVGLVRALVDAPGLAYRGLLTHAGHAYGAGRQDAATIFTANRERLESLRSVVRQAGLPGGQLSAGDTPGFAAVADWTGLDEARPGNFVFFDLMQLANGACATADLACAVAAPVIGVYPARRQVVVHAGAVHLSKERLGQAAGGHFGRLQTLTPAGLGDLASDGVVTALSQEHGVVTFADASAAADWRPGDLALIAPVHSCLACEQFGFYLTTGGARLPRYRRD